MRCSVCALLVCLFLAGTAVGQVPPTGAPMNYYGGPVLGNVQVVVVFWGPAVLPAVVSGIGPFYQAVTASHYFALLSEYSTVGVQAVDGHASSNQTIGSGTLGGVFTISPSRCRAPATCTVTDSQIQQELLAQIRAGALPAPVFDNSGNDNTLYMVYFPPHVVITFGKYRSCVNFCGYHGNASWGSSYIAYGVMPDFGAGGSCHTSCGRGTQFQNVTMASSHELAESVTDTDAGVTTALDYPLAWVNGAALEVGDLCNNYTTVAAGFTVQLIWSNMQKRCASGPVQLQFTPARPRVKEGAQLILTLMALDSRGVKIKTYSGTVHFTSSDPDAILPPDYTFTASNLGSHSFPFTFKTIGSQTLTARDVRAGGVAGSTTVQVTP